MLLTKEQSGFLKKYYTRIPVSGLTAELNKTFRLNMKTIQIRSFISRHKIHSGRTGRFEKGNVPYNKGTKGLNKANSGTFKKGNTPPNRKPLFSERICSKDGYVLIKIRERDPHTGFPTRYRHKHVVVWEKANGPTPRGHTIIFKDGNKLNINLDNLECITRAELLQLNRMGYNNAPDKLKPSILVLAKVKVRTSELIKKSPLSIFRAAA